jgi:acylglycerol lipase
MNNDITFYIQGWEPEGTPKALVCLVHGLGEHTGRYEHVGKALNEAGYAIFGFDLRGHGKTGGTRGHIASLDDTLLDIQRFIGFQKQNYPDVPIFLYGHSLGGLFALTYVLQHKDELQGVIVTGAALRSALQEQKGKIAMAKILGSIIPGITIPTGLVPATLSHDPDVVQAYIDDPLVHGKASLGLGKASLSAIDFCFTHAREFSSPLLIMHGALDELTYPSGSEDFAELASENNKDVTLKLWDGLFHEIHNEPEKEDVFKVMIEWLDKHL